MLFILSGGKLIFAFLFSFKYFYPFSGEVKLSMDPLLHWLQYPHLLPQSDPMKQ
jgi:hypothetical protein